MNNKLTDNHSVNDILSLKKEIVSSPDMVKLTSRPDHWMADADIGHRLRREPRACPV